jgi:hypothetical protein
MSKIELSNELLLLTQYMLRKYDFSKDVFVTNKLNHILKMKQDDQEYRQKLVKLGEEPELT